MLFFRKLVFLALSIGIFSFENAADAGVIYNNLPPVTSIGGTDPIAVDGPSYNSFSTGSSVAVLTDVKMLLQRSLGTASHFTVTLLSDSSKSPGAFIKTLGNFNDSDLSLSASVYDISVNSYVLAANTRYWIELNSVSGATSVVEWNYASSSAGVGVSNEYWAYSPGGVLTVYANADSSTPYQMSVTTSSAVPEPGTLGQVLATLGVGAFFAARRKAR